MKQRDLIYAVGVVLILIGSVAGLGSQSNLWESATIVSDSTAPIINAGASTHGKVATPGDLKPTLLCFITENNELTRVTATIQQWNLLMWTQNHTHRKNRNRRPPHIPRQTQHGPHLQQRIPNHIQGNRSGGTQRRNNPDPGTRRHRWHSLRKRHRKLDRSQKT